jgi:hypothetical protein
VAHKAVSCGSTSLVSIFFILARLGGTETRYDTPRSEPLPLNCSLDRALGLCRIST